MRQALELVEIARGAERLQRPRPLRRGRAESVHRARDRVCALLPTRFGVRRRPRATRITPAIARVAKRRGITVTQVALAWLLARYERMLPIPGTRSVRHLEENLAAADVELDARRPRGARERRPLRRYGASRSIATRSSDATVAQPIVKTVLPLLPELDRLRRQAIAAPVRRQRQLAGSRGVASSSATRRSSASRPVDDLDSAARPARCSWLPRGRLRT